MKRVLHIFATKLISKDIQNCNCFLVPSYDLFASAHKSSISRAIGDRHSQIEKHVVVSAFSAGRQLRHKGRMFQGCIPLRVEFKYT